MTLDMFRINDKLTKKHKLLRGDCTYLAKLENHTIDLIVTSPPYNLGKQYAEGEDGDSKAYKDYMFFTHMWLQNCLLWAKEGGRLCVNIPIDTVKGGRKPVMADVVRHALFAGWTYHSTIIWNNGNVLKRTAWGSWMSASAPHITNPCEAIVVFSNGEWKKPEKGKSTMTDEEFKEYVYGYWTFGGENATRIGHEAPFPRELPRRCIKLFSFEGDRVLDPFAGSGTTLIEAILNGRIAIGIEKEDRYIELAQKRIAQECGISIQRR